MAQKKKKNFKSVTGVKFSDLIMPLVLGGIGSYSRDAGRGVGLGLSAFRTFQSGKEYSDEQTQKKAMAEFFQQRADQLGGAAPGTEDIVETGTVGFYGDAGVATPTPTPQGETDEPVEVTDEDAEQEIPVESAERPKFADIMGLIEGIGAPVTAGVDDNQAVVDSLGSDKTDQILAEKMRQEAMRGDSLAGEQQRFNETLAQLASVNPSAAGYMGAQEGAGGIAHKRKLMEFNELARLNATSSKERMAATRDQLLLKHDLARDEIHFRALENRISQVRGPNGEPWKFDKQANGGRGAYFDADNNLINMIDYKSADGEQNVAYYNMYADQYKGYLKQIHDGSMVESDPEFIRVKKMLPQVAQLATAYMDEQKFQLENLKRQQQGLPPIQRKPQTIREIENEMKGQKEEPTDDELRLAAEEKFGKGFAPPN